jgi:hypothetical protein
MMSVLLMTVIADYSGRRGALDRVCLERTADHWSKDPGIAAADGQWRQPVRGENPALRVGVGIAHRHRAAQPRSK